MGCIGQASEDILTACACGYRQGKTQPTLAYIRTAVYISKAPLSARKYIRSNRLYALCRGCMDTGSPMATIPFILLSARGEF